MNKTLILLCLLCLVSYQSRFKKGFLRNLQEALPYQKEIDEEQNTLDQINAKIAFQTQIANSDDFAAKIDASNSLIELNFQKANIMRNIANFYQKRQEIQQQEAEKKQQDVINSSLEQMNKILGVQYQELQQNTFLKIENTLNANDLPAILVQAQKDADALISQAQEKSDYSFVFMGKLKNLQNENLNKNIDFYTKDNASNTVISPQGKLDAAKDINDLKAKVENNKKQIAAFVLERTVKTKSIIDNKANFAILLKQWQENQQNQIIVLAAYKKLQDSLNDYSLIDQQKDLENQYAAMNEEWNRPDTTNDRRLVLNGVAADIRFFQKRNQIEQIKLDMQRGQYKLEVAQKQQLRLQVISAQLEKNKAAAPTQFDKDNIQMQQEKTKYQLNEVAAQLKQISDENAALIKKLADTANLKYQQELSVRTAKGDIDSLNAQIQDNENKKEDIYFRIESGVDNAPNVGARIDFLRSELGKVKQFNDLNAIAKQLNDKLNSSNKAFIEASNAQANTNLSDLNKQLAALKPTDSKVSLQQYITAENAKLANLKTLQASQLAEYSSKDKQIQGGNQSYLDFINRLIGSNQYEYDRNVIASNTQYIIDMNAKLQWLLDKLASSSTAESEKNDIKIEYNETLNQIFSVTNNRDKLNLKQNNYENIKSQTRVKDLTAQIADCTKKIAAATVPDQADVDYCNYNKQQLEQENATIKLQGVKLAEINASLASQGVYAPLHLKVDDTQRQLKAIEEQISVLWNKLYQYKENNQEQVEQQSKNEDRVSVLKQQLGQIKQYDQMVYDYKVLLSKQITLQQVYADSQIARIKVQIVDTNKLITTATDANKKATLQMQIEGYNAALVKIANDFNSQTKEKLGYDIRMANMLVYYTYQLNMGIQTNQSKIHASQIEALSSQIANLNSQINQKVQYLSANTQMPDMEVISTNESIASLTKQRNISSQSRDQISDQNAQVQYVLGDFQYKNKVLEIADCKKNATLNPNPDITAYCNQLQSELDGINLQIKSINEQKVQLAASIASYTPLIQAQQKIDDSSKQMNDIFQQIQNLLQKFQLIKQMNEEQAANAPDPDEATKILKNQLNQLKDVQAMATALKDLLVKFPVAQKAFQDSYNANVSPFYDNLVKSINTAKDPEEKANLQKQLDHFNASVPKNRAQFAQTGAQNANVNAQVLNMVDNFVNNQNIRIGMSQAASYNAQFGDINYNVSLANEEIQIFQEKLANQSISSAEREKSKEQILIRQNKILSLRLDYAKVQVLSQAARMAMQQFQYKDLIIQLTECNRKVAANKVVDQNLNDSCKAIQVQIDNLNIEINKEGYLKAQNDQQASFLQINVDLKNKIDANKKLLDDSNRQISDQENKIREYKEQFESKINASADLKVKIDILKDQLSKAKEFEPLVAALKALLEKSLPLQKTYADSLQALVVAQLADVAKRIAIAISNKADTTNMLSEQANLNAASLKIKEDLTSKLNSLALYIKDISGWVAQYPLNIKLAIATYQKMLSDHTQELQMQDSKLLSGQIVDVEDQLSTQTDPQQNVSLFNTKQNLILKKLEADNNACKAFIESMEARKYLLNAQIAQQTIDSNQCNAALLANKDLSIQDMLTQKCNDLKAAIVQSNADLKGVDERKKICDDQSAKNKVSSGSAVLTQKVTIALNKIQTLQNNINNGVEVEANKAQVVQLQNQAAFLQNAQKQEQLVSLPAEITALTSQIALEKDAVKLADLKQQLAQKKADQANLTKQVADYAVVIKKQLDENLVQATKAINEQDAAAKSEILAGQQKDAALLKQEADEQSKAVKAKMDVMNAKIEEQNAMLDQLKFENDLKDKKARQQLLDISSAFNKDLKADEAEILAKNLKIKQELDSRIAQQLKEVATFKEAQLSQAKIDATIDGYKKKVIDQIQLE